MTEFIWRRRGQVAGEAQDLATFFGVAKLDVGLSKVQNADEKLRVLCGTLLKTPQFSLVGLAHPPQKTTPKVVLPGFSYEALCKTWSAKALPSDKWTATCGKAAMTAKKKIP